MPWTTATLADFFAARGVPSHAYSFYLQRDDAICLDKVDNEWLVYFSERGARRELAWASSEAEALDYVRGIVLDAHPLP